MNKQRKQNLEWPLQGGFLNSAPWPAKLAKARAKDLIGRLADAGMSDFDGAIEHGQNVRFATTRVQSTIHNVDARGAIAYAEMVDAFSTMVWLFREQLLAKVTAGLDEIADDKHALDQSSASRWKRRSPPTRLLPREPSAA